MSGANHDWGRKLVLFKLETTEGTDAGTVSTANAMLVENFQPTFMTADQKTRNIERPFFGAKPTLPASFRRGFNFDVELVGSGTNATTQPGWLGLLQPCGFGVPQQQGSTAITVTPITTGIPSATLDVYLDDLKMSIYGSRSTVGFNVQDGEIPILSFKYLGIPDTGLITDLSTTPAAVPASGMYANPLIASSAVTTITLGGYAYGVRSWQMDVNADLQYRSLINPAPRINYADRSLSGTLVVEVPDLGVANPFANIRTGATLPAKMVHGTTAGNIIQFDMPALQITGDVAISNEQGKVMASFPVSALPVAGNDEFVVTTK